MVVSNPEKDKALEDLHAIALSLDRIAYFLEDIAIEVQRPHEEAMERQRKLREAPKRMVMQLPKDPGRGAR
ncbi:MAG: hypothetical protein IIY70_01555 [Oscillospiraceae bacterium]|nr:hypothetical protein [Oscillospiraceae bacterium]